MPAAHIAADIDSAKLVGLVPAAHIAADIDSAGLVELVPAAHIDSTATMPADRAMLPACL